MAGIGKSVNAGRYWKYSKTFHHLVDILDEIHKDKSNITLSYENGMYRCPVLDFEALDKLTEMELSLKMKVRIVTHDRTLADRFQDAKVALLIAPYTMLADVGEITRKKKKDKSYHYDIELSWS